MYLETLHLKNFRGYEDRKFSLHPNFNLIIGENGAGKTSFLEAVAVAIGSWLLGFPGQDSRNIRERDVRKVLSYVERRYQILPQHPVRVSASGFIHIACAGRRDSTETINYTPAGSDSEVNPRSQPVRWERSIETMGGKTNRQGANELKKYAEMMASSVLDQNPKILPLIRYFGAGRLWESVRDTDGKTLSKNKGKQPSDLVEDADDIDNVLNYSDRLLEPFYGYRMSVDKRCNPNDLIRWMGIERRNEIDEEGESPALRLVYKAIEEMLSEVKTVRYSNRLKTIVFRHHNGKRTTFSELSDGYRNVVAIAADLAIKAAMLNPQLAEKALQMTPGVVLIDELDLHLHPNWQRRIIADLRRTFPLVQFICTTHSPFLIQSLWSGEELIVLDGQPTANLGQLPLEEIARGIMGVDNTDVSERYDEMKQVARHYLEDLDEAARAPEEKQQHFKDRLAKSIAPYAQNPAYQAFLEMKRAAKLGE